MTVSTVGQRAQDLEQLAHERFDLLIAGGGATGAAIARDAALRGLRVALCDRGDFAGQTSSQSSKLIHGGLRYLQYLNLGLVFESLRERRVLLQTAPHLCRPIEFVFPSYQGQRPRLAELDVGIALYNALALWRPPLEHGRIPASQLWTDWPQLRREGLAGARSYLDCQTDDARLVIENVIDATAAGAVCVPHVEVTGPLETQGGALRGAVLRDVPTGVSIEVQARVVVNATGPFSDAFRRRFLSPDAKPRLRPTLGVHLVLDSQRLPTGGRALVLRTRHDGRLFFVMPAGARTLVGTTDTDLAGSDLPPTPGMPIAARAADVDYLLTALAHAFPSARLGRDDVLSAFAGLRPLIASPGHSASATSREHEIFSERPGLVTIAGGKLTTMRAMGRQTVDHAILALATRGHTPTLRPSSTAKRPLPGAATHDVDAGLLDLLPAATRRHLSARYGTRAPLVAALAMRSHRLQAPIVPGLPDIWAEVVHAVKHEYALTPEDVLRRRLSIFLHARGQGVDALPGVIELMTAELGWDGEQAVAQERAYRRHVAEQRAWTH